MENTYLNLLQLGIILIVQLIVASMAFHLYRLDKYMDRMSTRKYRFFNPKESNIIDDKKTALAQFLEDLRYIIVFMIPLISLAWYFSKLIEFSRDNYQGSDRPKITDIMRYDHSWQNSLLKIIMKRYV